MTPDQLLVNNVKATVGQLAFDLMTREAELTAARARIKELEAKMSELDKPKDSAE